MLLIGICLTAIKAKLSSVGKQIDVYLTVGQSNAAGFTTNNRSKYYVYSFLYFLFIVFHLYKKNKDKVNETRFQ